MPEHNCPIMGGRTLSGQRKFEPVEIPPATFETGNLLRKIGEKVTVLNLP